MFRFWKLTPSGAVHAVTTPETLFPAYYHDEAVQKTQTQIHQGQKDGSNSTTLNSSPQEYIFLKKQDLENRAKATGGRAVGAPVVVPTNAAADGGSNCRRRPNMHQQQQQQQQKQTTLHVDDRQTASPAIIPTTPSAGSHLRGSNDHTLGTQALRSCGGGSCGAGNEKYPSVSNQEVTNIHNQGSVEGVSVAMDKVGRAIKTNVRTAGPPDGTLEPLGWGWGGQFRLGNGREGEELWPKRLHPDFKARSQNTDHLCLQLC